MLPEQPSTQPGAARVIGPAPAFAGALPVGVILLSTGVEALLLVGLLGDSLPGGVVGWLALHALASGAGALALARLLGASHRVLLLAGVLMLALPFAGSLGATLSLALGQRAANRRHREPEWWQFTANPELPFTTPIGRPVTALDRRGFAEQLMHAEATPTLYRRVLAAGRMRTSLSVDALEGAVRHPDERIRLTGYQILDRKVTTLNDEIDRLERSIDDNGDVAGAALRIASNYWELLTLEQGEPIARAQLLAKATAATVRSIAARPDDRNAHFTLGRILLRQGEPLRANQAFERASALGMPLNVTLPYRAEAAFGQRDFAAVRHLLGSIDEAFGHYPPLQQVMAAWR